MSVLDNLLRSDAQLRASLAAGSAAAVPTSAWLLCPGEWWPSECLPAGEEASLLFVLVFCLAQHASGPPRKTIALTRCLLPCLVATAALLLTYVLLAACAFRVWGISCEHQCVKTCKGRLTRRTGAAKAKAASECTLDACGICGTPGQFIPSSLSPQLPWSSPR